LPHQQGRAIAPVGNRHQLGAIARIDDLEAIAQAQILICQAQGVAIAVRGPFATAGKVEVQQQHVNRSGGIAPLAPALLPSSELLQQQQGIAVPPQRLSQNDQIALAYLLFVKQGGCRERSCEGEERKSKPKPGGVHSGQHLNGCTRRSLF
jgi:hypothetical protein